MENTPDYKFCSLAQLYDVAQHIDREKYPKRFALVLQEIQNKEKAQEEIPSRQDCGTEKFSTRQDSQEMRGGCWVGCASALVGALVGAIVGVVCLILFIPTPDPEVAARMDGMNRWGGHAGAAMIGMLFGGISGPLVTKSKEPLKTTAITLLIFVAVMLILSH